LARRGARWTGRGTTAAWPSRLDVSNAKRLNLAISELLLTARNATRQ
jgi:hypothetical protein